MPDQLCVMSLRAILRGSGTRTRPRVPLFRPLGIGVRLDVRSRLSNGTGNFRRSSGRPQRMRDGEMRWGLRRADRFHRISISPAITKQSCEFIVGRLLDGPAKDPGGVSALQHSAIDSDTIEVRLHEAGRLHARPPGWCRLSGRLEGPNKTALSRRMLPPRRSRFYSCGISRAASVYVDDCVVFRRARTMAAGHSQQAIGRGNRSAVRCNGSFLPRWLNSYTNSKPRHGCHTTHKGLTILCMFIVGS
jgi:hypothetical protein